MLGDVRHLKLQRLHALTPVLLIELLCYISAYRSLLTGDLSCHESLQLKITGLPNNLGQTCELLMYDRGVDLRSTQFCWGLSASERNIK